MSKQQLEGDDKVLNATLNVLDAYNKFFDTPEGHIILFDLMKKSHFLQPTYNPCRHASERNEGRRELFLHILETVNRDPADVIAFIKQQELARRGDILDDYED